MTEEDEEKDFCGFCLMVVLLGVFFSPLLGLFFGWLFFGEAFIQNNIFVGSVYSLSLVIGIGISFLICVIVGLFFFENGEETKK